MLLGKALRSRVGQRLFLRFLLATLLPLAVMGTVAYLTISGMLIDNARERLAQDAKLLGMNQIEHVNQLAQALKRIARGPTAAAASELASSHGFSRLTELDPSHLQGLAKEQRHHLERGLVSVRLSPQPAPHAAMQALVEGSRIVVQGDIDPATLWANDRNPEHACILTQDLAPLHCSPWFSKRDIESWRAAMARQNKGSLDWRAHDEDYVVGFWKTSLDASYAHPGFIVVVADQKRNVLQGLSHFQLIFPAMLLLGLGLSAWLALGQIRRQLSPLDALTHGTEQIAKGDFSARVSTEGSDEFALLARSFNQMSAHLDGTFNMLGLLAELDRAIIQSSRFDAIVGILLKKLPGALPISGARVITLERGASSVACDPGAAHAVCHMSSSLRETLEQQFVPPERAGCLWLNPGDALHAGLARALAFMPQEPLLACPVWIDTQLHAVLMLAPSSVPGQAQALMSAGQNLADRLSVAACNLAAEHQLIHQAHHDALTQLPNRTLLADRAEQAMLHASRDGCCVGLLLVDLDNFKQINDSLGHSFGDKLLVECARRLRSSVRLSDTVARVGGDEFVLLVPDLVAKSANETLARLGESINAIVAEPFVLADRQVTTLASIGIALYPDHTQHFEDLFKMADAAMYESKREAPGHYRFYSQDMNGTLQERFELTQALRTAIAQNQMVLHYQPKVDPTTREIQGAEALVRWFSPQHGQVPPDRFVPLLDEMGLSIELDEWVLDEACRQMSQWDNSGLRPFPVSINLAPSHLLDNRLCDKVTASLERHGLPAKRLEIEIIEAAAISPSPAVRQNLVRLQQMGIQIALDDFGTGYSSLVYLTTVPLNILKLDRGFISNLTVDTKQQSIVEHILSLAKSLGLTIVAEGVEDEAQLRWLEKRGCDLIQGFLISRPLPPGALAAMHGDLVEA